MNSLQNLTIKDCKGIGSNVLFSNGHVAIFGDLPNNDLVFVKRFKGKLKSELFERNVNQDIAENECDELMKKVLLLGYTDALALFSFSEVQIKLVKQTIKKLSATHIRLYIHDDNLRIAVFDYRKFSAENRLQRKKTLLIEHLDLSIRVIDEFSFTLLASSFSKLPTQDCNVRVGANDICAITPVKGDDDSTYYYRNQLVIEPMTVFHSARISQDISFVFHPTTFGEGSNTSQSLSE